MPRAVRTKKAAPATPRDDVVFRALADETRRRIVAILGGGERRDGREHLAKLDARLRE